GYFSLQLDRPLFSKSLFKMPKLNIPFGKQYDGLVIEPENTSAKSKKNPAPRKEVKPDHRPPPEISDRALPPKKANLSSGKQGDFFGPYSLPSIDLLTPAPEQPNNVIDKAGLERNARLLESVLDDFHVKGTINAVRPGPVVTMYELEPAPGIKASRVIQLAEDIARNMSALSARVAAIPGRTVMGIELPNKNREMVSLHEMIGSDSFQDQSGQLPIILGKNISGDPVIADLAPMPHLLIAGTTGSGKSVGLNCMIVSLLYRMTPDQCKMIMIDPKMLELSTYDDIPHLLSPVVTEPAKAVRALKWAVEQMEERYRMMSSVSVRNLANYNEKVKVAKVKGQPLGRKVQTGYDPETSRPIYEEEQLDYEVLPQIVIIVDELADLMMTAGKEVEFLIQRLAQKARAAGIHLIMATQRPSVDVITGVIKANLPTRISFHVTSKIDSRTILGEQGAEQLLGKGDMLYMPGGKQLTRVHGPFVSDDEVRAIADHWRTQGAPDYIQAVTEEPEDGGFALDGADLSDNKEDRQYAQACQIVFESQKVSTSWLQRQLRIGYNTAARIIDRMEEDEMISPPNHIGRREVLRDQHGQPL
ncbi:DNA translocase FtsK, partial [hydrothermal vent metagenome]